MNKKYLFLYLSGFLMTVSLLLIGPSPLLAQNNSGELYVVQKDDSLSKIADKYLGDLLAYPLIVEATNAKATTDSSFSTITNPNVIEVGQKIWIPDLAAADLALKTYGPNLSCASGNTSPACHSNYACNSKRACYVRRLING